MPSKSTVVEPDGACPIAVTMPSLTHTSTSTGSVPDPSATMPPANHTSVKGTSRALETTLLNTGEFDMRYRTQQW